MSCRWRCSRPWTWPPPADRAGARRVINGCAAAIDWYTEVFGATEISPRMTGPDGSVGHAEISIGDPVIMMGDEWPAALHSRSAGGVRCSQPATCPSHRRAPARHPAGDAPCRRGPRTRV
ncbi:MAG: VOC family protein [Euzebya sp.]